MGTTVMKAKTSAVFANRRALLVLSDPENNLEAIPKTMAFATISCIYTRKFKDLSKRQHHHY